jgi:hypothetical protein
LREVEREIAAETSRLGNDEADIQTQWRMWVRHLS